MDPSGRISLVRGGDLLLPAQCLLCGRSAYNTDELFLDIQRDIEDFGTIYFCIECGQEVGYGAGCANPREFSAIAIANEQLTAENERQEKMMERLADGIEHDILRFLSSRGITAPVDGDEPDVSSDASGQDSTGDELFTEFYVSDSGTDTDDGESVESGEPEPTESSTVDGPDDTNEPAIVNVPEFRPIEL